MTCWLAGLIGSIILYLHGYVSPPQQPGLLEITRRPGVDLAYFLTYLGNPFTRLFDPNSAIIIGCILLGFFVGAVGYLGRHRKESSFVARVLPWIMLSSFALMNAVLTMIGRVGYGSGQSVAPRYITFSVMLPIGLLFVLTAIYQHWRERASSPFRIKATGLALAGCAVIGLGLNLWGSICVLDNWWGWKQARIASQVLLEFVQVTNESHLMTDEHLTGGDFPALRRYSVLFGPMGYLRPDPLKTNLISGIADVHAAPSENMAY